MRSQFTPTAIERFWSKVHRTSCCWLWTGAHTPPGYGKVHIGGRFLYAHRVSWLLANGELADAVKVLHNCPCGDTPGCVNPGHLWVGTIADNQRDMVRKGRNKWTRHPEMVRGAAHPQAVLSDHAVAAIRAAYAAGTASQDDLARQHNVHQATISRIISRQNWRHLP